MRGAPLADQEPPFDYQKWVHEQKIAHAVLAFIGGLISKDKIAIGKLGTVADSLTWFAVGVACAMAAMGLAYFTNYCIAGAAHSQIRKWDPPFVEPGPKTAFWTRSASFFRSQR
jgi:hypothetical protein